MKQRKLVIGLLVMLAVAVSGFTFAFWAGSLAGDSAAVESNTVTVGTGEAVTTEVTFGTNTQTTGNLVPAGRADDSVGGAAANVESVVFTFNVFWDEEALVDNGTYDGDSATLGAVISNVTIDGSALTLTSGEAGLLNFSISNPGTILLASGSATVVTVTLTLDEPADVNEYDDYANLVVDFDVTFTVTP